MPIWKLSEKTDPLTAGMPNIRLDTDARNSARAPVSPDVGRKAGLEKADGMIHRNTGGGIR